MHEPTAITILLIPGSLRAASVNRAVLRTAARLAGEGIEATLYEPVVALPHFNPDDDPVSGPAPPAACRRIRVPRRAVGPDGLVAEDALRAEIVAAVAALAHHLSAVRISDRFRPAA
jgi:hypothetical protein